MKFPIIPTRHLQTAHVPLTFLTRGHIATRGQSKPRVAEVPRVAKLGHAWLQDQVVMPRVAKESHAWLSLATPWRYDHAWLCFFPFLAF